jgi:hypothetical protein
MPVQHDPFAQIVNVHWDDGLAVEFGDRDQDAPKPVETEENI